MINIIPAFDTDFRDYRDTLRYIIFFYFDRRMISLLITAILYRLHYISSDFAISRYLPATHYSFRHLIASRAASPSAHCTSLELISSFTYYAHFASCSPYIKFLFIQSPFHIYLVSFSLHLSSPTISTLSLLLLIIADNSLISWYTQATFTYYIIAHWWFSRRLISQHL
jgi:hypothetical protein